VPTAADATMIRVRDISLAIEPGLPTWPTSEGFRVRSSMRLADGDPANVSVVEMDVHTGTHVEAALHFLEDGGPIDGVPLEHFVGPARIVVVEGDAVTAAALDALGIDADPPRLLIRTANSERWAQGWGPFDPVYVALTTDAAQWILDREYVLVGLDHLSIQQYGNDGQTHRVLMRAGVSILEGLNLAGVEPGVYTLVAAPIRLIGTEAAPARALLIDQAP
jgi:arylformamidase